MTPDHLGPYRIEKLLGSGGMGAVYSGVHDDTGDQAAIKVLAPQIATDANFRARFESEVETLKKLKHPHIVQLYGYGEHEGQLFYSMELVEGMSLQEKLKQEGPYEWRKAVQIAIDVALALKHAHDRGIIHRDLKPANLLIDSSGSVKLTDFGIAKLFGGNSLTAAGGVMGTADYMAPEQAEGVTVTHRVDLYSLGGVLYALLTGRPPFLGNSLVEVLDMLKHDTPTPVSRLMPKVPRQLDWVVIHLLEKNPQKRTPTALAVANQLRSLLHALSSERTAVESPTLTDEDQSHDDEFHISESLTKVTPPSDESAKIASKETAFVSSREASSNNGTAQEPLEIPESDTSGNTSIARFHSKSDLETAGEQPNSAAAHDPAGASNHFTTVAPEELGAEEASTFKFDDDSLDWPRIAALALGLVVLALLGWYTLRKPNAEQLWNEIQTIATTADAEQLYEAEPQLEQFLSRFPEHQHAAAAREYQAEIELMRLQRRLQRRLRRSSADQPISAVEQLYLAAMAEAASHPQRAVEQLQSLVALYQADAQADPSTRQVVELAQLQLEQMATVAEQSQHEHETLLGERLEFAAKLAKTDTPAAAEMYRAIRQLYGEKPWAKAYVDQANEALLAIDKPTEQEE